MKKILIITTLLFTTISANNINNEIISFKKSKNAFPLVENSKATSIFYSENDFKGVIKVINDLQNDMLKVTDVKPESFSTKNPNKKNIVLIGTASRNELIESLIKRKLIDISSIENQFDSYIIKLINNPFPNVKRALVIVGSDKRGTIYGVYEISKQIGVSPWYWWADVPIKKQKEIFVKENVFLVDKPLVKYRGIFINDEAPALTNWTYEKFGGYNHKFYENVFELILRLKGNYLWPAMWNNNFDDDDPLNPELADMYGVVMGRSHHEPMMRSWKEWPKYGKGEWNYEKNETVLREFWKFGIERMKNYESIITLGMRGDGDEAMSEDANIELLEKIINDQRKIISDVTKKDVTQIPQIWALYKEVQEYYDKGMKVPDDVTLLLCDDNWGNLRKLPKLNDKPRKGGYGIYYHFDYVGGPRNYKWLNTNQIERVWEQMNLAYNYGADRIWIVNVGDIKPMEFPISFFLEMAWNPLKFNETNISNYYKEWCKQQFPEEFKNEIAEILSLYTKYNSRRKPELISQDTYSLTNYNEFERVVNDFKILTDKAKTIYNKLSDEYKSAYYQLILYPTEASSNLNELYYNSAKNKMYAIQGRVLTDSLANKVIDLFNYDKKLSNDYHNLNNKKWNHMMSQTHIGYTYWQQPDSNYLPILHFIKNPNRSEMGISVEGDKNFYLGNYDNINLQQFDSYFKQTYFIEIFNRGTKPFKYQIKNLDPFVKLSSPKNILEKEEKIFVSIDWNLAPKGITKSRFSIHGPDEKVVFINLTIKNYDITHKNIFVETNGYISIDAEKYSSVSSDDKVKVIPNLGRTSSSIHFTPVNKDYNSINNDNPFVEYELYFQTTGKVKVNVYLSPTLNFNNIKDGIKYAISIDNEEPKVVSISTNPNPPDLNRDPIWNKWVADNVNIQKTEHNISSVGFHKLKIFAINPGVVIQKIVIDCGGLKESYLGPLTTYIGK
ncbi:MAG: glycosyl hydrolase 115 family protein [Melioribacteraceae bacterium]|nr:glycosyl hydrolase 115 family protein [Melioribacteraceae bacterium]